MCRDEDDASTAKYRGFGDPQVAFREQRLYVSQSSNNRTTIISRCSASREGPAAGSWYTESINGIACQREGCGLG